MSENKVGIMFPGLECRGVGSIDEVDKHRAVLVLRYSAVVREIDLVSSIRRHSNVFVRKELRVAAGL